MADGFNPTVLLLTYSMDVVEILFNENFTNYEIDDVKKMFSVSLIWIVQWLIAIW